MNRHFYAEFLYSFVYIYEYANIYTRDSRMHYSTVCDVIEKNLEQNIKIVTENEIKLIVTCGFIRIVSRFEVVVVVVQLEL